MPLNHSHTRPTHGRRGDVSNPQTGEDLNVPHQPLLESLSGWDLPLIFTTSLCPLNTRQYPRMKNWRHSSSFASSRRGRVPRATARSGRRWRTIARPHESVLNWDPSSSTAALCSLPRLGFVGSNTTRYREAYYRARRRSSYIPLVVTALTYLPLE